MEWMLLKYLIQKEKVCVKILIMLHTFKDVSIGDRDSTSTGRNSSDMHLIELFLNIKEYYSDALEFIGFRQDK